MDARERVRVREAIDAAVGGYRVKQWMAGSTAKQDRPTLAEVQAAGFVVVLRDAGDPERR